MKLDVDLIREILLWCEENTPSEKQSYFTDQIKIKDYPNNEITHHFRLLIDSDYINASDASTFGGKNYLIDSLTMDGYQYLEAIKSDTIWDKYKEAAGKVGIEAVKFALPILADYIKHQLGSP